jgi:hypothetical protein
MNGQAESTEKISTYERLKEKARAWFEVHFEGSVESHEDLSPQNKTEVAFHTAATVTAELGRFFGPVLLIDAAGFLAQKFHFKPRARQDILNAIHTRELAGSLSLQKQIEMLEAEIQSRITEMDDSNPAKKQEMHLKLMTILNTSAENETFLDDACIIKFKETLKEYITPTISGKELLKNIAITATVKLLPFLKVKEGMVVAAKVLKALKSGYKAHKNIKAIKVNNENHDSSHPA